ncbi:hypothetical protein M413DRAFT_444444 [Hebeloma cylindrosporum]|uniref:NB-ARC domain-containing protein n=1 Tax=Hebeloma cylindrosporum TaxID=76867 RepID=A0A0C3C1L3_HEBCY|nr:hypothetical protein M413DRAFT_444444 [Hebeloma cylindrosporum h7]
MGRGAKKQGMETKPSEKPEKLPVIAPQSTLVEDLTEVIELKSDELSNENSLSVVPTTTAYTMATMKEVLTVSQTAAGLMPVPFLQDAIGVALKIIQICEDASAVEQKVRNLQERISCLMIDILHHVTPEVEEENNQLLKGIEEDIKQLLRTLETINEDLQKISDQNRWIQAIYKELNLSTLEDCMDRLSVAVERFTLSNDLHDSKLLHELLGRLSSLANKIDAMHEDMKHRAIKVDVTADKVDDIHIKVNNIQKVLSELKRSGTRSDTLARQDMPLKPEIFHGRDDLVNDIAQLLLQEETSRVCIIGPGGMGKTSVSLAVVESPPIQERFPDGNLIWVPCIEATSATLFLEILYSQLQIPTGDKQLTLAKIISELAASKEPRLIMLDNFETPWNTPGGHQKIGDIIRKLAKLSHVAILVTMRGNHPPCDKAIKWQSKDLKATDEAACLRIYHDIYPGSENDPDVVGLLAALGHMPFAVKLVANLGLDSKWNAKRSLEEWLTLGPDLFDLNEAEENMNRSIRPSVESNLVKRNPNALTLLAILSLLPAGTSEQNLSLWAPALTIGSAIATLSQAALLVEKKRENSVSPVLFVVPVVQSFMQQKNRIAEEVRTQIHLSCCEYILSHACRVHDPTFPQKWKALAAEDTNIQSILFSSPTPQRNVPSHRTLEALVAFSWHRCDTKPSLEIANHVVTVAKASGVVRYIASAVWCLGKTYFQLSDFRLSCDHLQEARQLFNTFPPDEIELRRLGGQCGIDLVNAARFEYSSEISRWDFALTVAEECAALSDDLLHGRGLVALGFMMCQHEAWNAALPRLNRAKTMLKDPLDLAVVCQVISWVDSQRPRFQFDCAEDAIQEAWKHAELTDSPFIQAQISLDFCTILFSRDKDAEAWKYADIALMKASYTGDQYTAGEALQLMGYGYIRKGDYENAYSAYEAAYKKYSPANDIDLARCCKYMGEIDSLRGLDPAKQIGVHRRFRPRPYTRRLGPLTVRTSISVWRPLHSRN